MDINIEINWVELFCYLFSYLIYCQVHCFEVIPMGHFFQDYSK